MIKLLHLADIHLGMENYGRTDPKTGLNSRLLDFLKSFDSAVDYAKENKIDLVLFAGDAFKTRHPSPTEQREFAKRIKKLALAGIPVVLLVGNHDIPNATGKANTLDIYHTLEIDNVYVLSKPKVLKLDLKNNEKIQIAALPWISKSILASKEDYKKKTISEIHEQMSSRLIRIIERLIQQIDTSLSCIFMAHTTVAGAEFGSEHKVYVGSDVLLPLSVFARQPFNYVALGHIHKYQILNENPPVVYSGSIDRVDFSEEKEDKGFVYLEINNKKVEYKFVPVPARRFLTINIKINENDQDPTEKCIQEIKRYKIDNAVVRVQIKIPDFLVEKLHENEIRRKLKKAHFIAAINREIIQQKREKRDLSYLDRLSVLDILEEYLKSKGVEKKRRLKLREYAQKLIQEK